MKTEKQTCYNCRFYNEQMGTCANMVAVKYGESVKETYTCKHHEKPDTKTGSLF